MSRVTHYIITHGARVSSRVTNDQHRSSPLIQGGLEIPAEVTVEMKLTEENVLAMKEYEALKNLLF